jgi:hypothetical protein
MKSKSVVRELRALRKIINRLVESDKRVHKKVAKLIKRKR